MVKYWVTIKSRDTGEVVYENGFYTHIGVQDELDEWDIDYDYDYTVEELNELEAAE